MSNKEPDKEDTGEPRKWPLYKLEELLIGVTPEAMRDAFDWGPDVGREHVS